MAKRKSVEAYYKECVDGYHDVLNDITGNSDVIVVEEIIPYGEKAVVGLVDDAKLQAKYIFDNFQYRFVMIAMSIQYGIIHAAWYKENPAEFENNLSKITADNLDMLASLIITSHMHSNVGIANQTYSWVFDEWQNVINPHWTLDNDREYIVASYKAAYQFGVSWYMQSVRK